ncbi:glycoside hydrolase [Aspergillus cavernicola]|uniref:Glycoside hydrolase n=1 Tax=Aspergillus cavernicola TaxID=176166 RepID=A0ABR4IJN1_9EURO
MKKYTHSFFLLMGTSAIGLVNGLVLPCQSNSTSGTHCGADLILIEFLPRALPRNGYGKVMSPGDGDGSFSGDDGISIELDEGINMAWSQFEHSQDVNVRILRRDGQAVDEEVIIRPTVHTFETQHVAGALVIRVPAGPKGHRFSVEFGDDLYTYRSNSNGYTTDGSGEVVSIEPRIALVIFASAFLPDELVPSLDGPDTKVMTPGAFSVADIGGAPIVYFPPGVYWIHSEPVGLTHIKLDASTYWVHLAPGAFVKGAVEYTTGNKDFYATGHGVLSGEIYVYQANVEAGYTAEKSDLTIPRPTTSSPPFNTMDLKDGSIDREDISVDIFDYKQVGAFFMQTDGPQMYMDGTVRDVFYHCNDDAIKTYQSDGWQPRNAHGVAIDTLYIIHTRYRKSETYVPSSIIGASLIYNGEPRLDPSMTISISVSNIICEGPSPGLFRLTPLQNYADFKVTGVNYVDGLVGGSVPIGDSIIATTEDTTYPGSEDLSMGLSISDWTVKGERVTMENAETLGQWNINAAYDGQWSIA